MKLEQIGVVYALQAFHTHFYLLYNLAILPLSCSFVWNDCCIYVASPLSLVCKMLCVFICMQLPPTPMTACATSYSVMHVTFVIMYKQAEAAHLRRVSTAMRIVNDIPMTELSIELCTVFCYCGGVEN